MAVDKLSREDLALLAGEISKCALAQKERLIADGNDPAVVSDGIATFLISLGAFIMHKEMGLVRTHFLAFCKEVADGQWRTH